MEEKKDDGTSEMIYNLYLTDKKNLKRDIDE
jgi:hypothetical protein